MAERAMKAAAWLPMFLRLFVPALALLVVGAILLGNAEVDREMTRLRSQEALQVRLGVGVMHRRLEMVGRDLGYLSTHGTLRAAIDTPTPERMAELAADFADFSGAKGIYDQIRWIDETGMERIRVDHVNGRPVVIPDERLQNKGKRYFFTDTMRLAPGETFVSPLDLNIENDRIEVPYKPMIRVGTPVVDAAGAKRGIVILNYHGRDLLQVFAEETAEVADHIMLVNREGYFLKSPRTDDEWGFMFKRADLSLEHRFPAAWRAVQAADTGQLRLDDGLWSWASVRPLQAGQRSSAGASDASAPSRGAIENREYVWKAVALVPTQQLDQVVAAIWGAIAAAAAVLAALFALGSWNLARAWAARRDAEQRLRQANADLEHAVAARTAQLQERLEELDQKNRQLTESAAVLGGILASSIDGYLNVDDHGRIIDANDTYARQSGYTREELLALHIVDLEAVDSAAEIAARIDRLRAAGHALFESRHRRKDGSLWDVEVSVVFRDIGDGRFFAFLRDITERRRMDQLLVRYMEDLSEAQEIARMGNWQFEHASGALVWSPSVYRLYGVDPAHFVPGYDSFMALVHPDDRQQVADSYRDALARRADYEFEHRIRTPAGLVRWVLQRCKTSYDVSGQPVQSRGIVLDITAQKELVEVLRESEQRFRDIAHVSADWIWEVDAAGRYTYASESVTTLLGYSPDELVGRTPFDLMPPEEAQRVGAAFAEVVAERRSFRDLENIVLGKDGRPHFTLTSGTPILGQGGALLGYRGVDRDVTGQRQMEEQIRQQAFIDSLTGLPNRRLLADHLRLALAASDRTAQHGALLFLDLDNFKPVNDRYGHLAGDLLLIEVARRLKRHVRQADTVARLGGDEFVVILGALAAAPADANAEAMQVATKVADALGQPYRIALAGTDGAPVEIEHRCTASIGIALFCGGETSAEELLRRADAAMYDAKTAGRDGIRFFAPGGPVGEAVTA
jgi:diguanylate cyclase (GGDEF)-like protein/PAS domain S-box-containing protein